MKLFSTPRNLPEAYGICLLLIRVAGLFPFQFDEAKNKFLISWKGLSYTILHLLIFTYVNITSISESWQDFSQPMAGNSSLSALGNLILRLLSTFITFVIITPLLFGSLEEVSSINVFLKLIEEFTLLGIDVTRIYRRVYLMTFCTTTAFFALVLFTAWHSIYFYEVITHKSPELKFYLVATLSTFYQLLYLTYAAAQLYGVYAISSEFNQYLGELRDIHKDLYEKQRTVQFEWMSTQIKAY